MIRLLPIIIISCFSSILYAESTDKPVKPLIYNEENLTKQLKGKTQEDVLKVLGEPAVKKPCEECEENLEYWWYNISEAGIFMHFRDGRVTSISVLTEDERSKEL